MMFTKTPLGGAYVIDVERLEDERGFFARSWCEREFKAHGLNPRLVQCNVSFNLRKGTLRGMHFQIAPYAETKLVRCTRGAAYDVILDLRPQSPTYTRWFATEISADNYRMVYVPEGCAHGFQTMEDDTELFYQMTEEHHPEAARGVRCEDETFGIWWPPGEKIISRRDATYPDFKS